MDNELPSGLDLPASRRSLLKGAALAGLGVAGTGLLRAAPALAAEAPSKITDAPMVEGTLDRVSTRSSPAYVFMSGHAFQPDSSSITYDSAGSRLLAASVGQWHKSLQLPQGVLITGVSFWVENPAGPVSNAIFVRTDPTAGTLVLPLFTKAATPVTAGVQRVDLDLGSGLPVDNSKYDHVLLWQSGAAAGQTLVGVRVAYALEPGIAFLPVPFRVADTRLSAGPIGPITGPLTSGGIYDFSVAGVAGSGIPAEATAVFGNLTAVEFAPGNGYMTIYPTGASLPNSSSINFGGGEPNQLANFFLAKLGTAGKLRIYVSGTSTNAILDIAGYSI